MAGRLSGYVDFSECGSSAEVTAISDCVVSSMKVITQAGNTEARCSVVM